MVAVEVVEVAVEDDEAAAEVGGGPHVPIIVVVTKASSIKQCGAHVALVRMARIAQVTSSFSARAPHCHHVALISILAQTHQTVRW